MLEELSIRNYALIDNLSLTFENHLNILTGETGAGKSIIVGSLSFLLGAKSDASVIRAGCDEASVSAVVSIAPANRDVRAWLSAREIESDDGSIIVRRSIKVSGRSSIYVQNVPLSRNDLSQLMGFLFDLHGQHDHESLLRKDVHRHCLDRFAGTEEDAAEFNRRFLELADRKKAFELSVNSERDRDSRIELLSYAVDEINKAAPKSGEIRELEAEAQRLSSFEKLSQHSQGAAAAFCGSDNSALGQIRKTRSSLESAYALDEGLAAVSKRMDDLYYEAEDLAEELRSYRDGLSYEPGRLEEVDDRLGLLSRLGKKYKPRSYEGGGAGPEDAILAYRAEAEQEIEALSQSEENREKLKAEIGALTKEIAVRAASLSAKRKDGAGKLGSEVNAILLRLGMPRARFEVRSGDKGRGATGNLLMGPWGADEVEFLISANSGEPLKELSRIASGGELSRVMLAIKTVLARSDAIETLVFDEIDAGIGGEVALAVGEYLEKMGTIKQIFCITHLASIAVRADNHIKVEKSEQRGRTQTTIKLLSGKERREEIARMLAGGGGGAALAHAADLLAKYGKK
ncbi:MAG: DNA repair protein RecN [Treponema sp.]|jgi:DNA repair protein RecN (Recombination protein N)|nr:DNA repair protein RecN [Treponema sp.]